MQDDTDLVPIRAADRDLTDMERHVVRNIAARRAGIPAEQAQKPLPKRSREGD